MLRLQLLGGFRAHADNVDVSSLAKQPRRAALLTLLAVERDVARDRVIAMLWPDAPQDRARHSLNQAIYYLRRLIAADWVELHGERCVVAPWITTDAGELEHAAASGDHTAVLRLYEGPLLAGSSLAATAEFDIWADGRRAAIDRLHRRARRRRIEELVAAGSTGEALHVAEEWCRLDPLEDEAQHRLIQLLAGAGQRAAALRQYAAYQRLLVDHGLKPLDETVALVEHLQQGELGHDRALDPRSPGGHAGAGPTGRTAASPGVQLPPLPLESAAPAWRDGAAWPMPRSRRAPPLLRTRGGLAALLAIVFLVNLVETTIETWIAARSSTVAHLRLELARASHWLEGRLNFEYHDLAGPVAVVGFTTSYFFLFPLLLGLVGILLARRSSMRPFRTFSVAVAINYVISLPFFLFFPVPERWAYPESGAMVLSDLVSSHLIDVFRPISGLDNSFPSFHVSLTVVAMLCSFLFRQRYRWSVLFLGVTVMLATIALGIHWAGDLVAGVAAGALSVALALRLDARWPDAELREPAPAPVPPRPRTALTSRELELR